MIKRFFIVQLLFLLCFPWSQVNSETKYRQRFNLPEEKKETTTEETIEEKASPAVLEKVDKADALSELQKQQEILEQYKPLIKPRTYADLMQVLEPAANLKLNRLPELAESIIPNRAPNIRLTPYLRKSFAHPAYKASFQGVEYLIAVNCEAPGSFDDCSTTPHNAFRGKPVYVKFIQSSDTGFNKVPGMKVGQTFQSVRALFDKDASIHGDGECLRTRHEWLACFDATELSIDKQR